MNWFWHDYSVWSWQFWVQVAIWVYLAFVAEKFLTKKWRELITAIKERP